MFNGNIGIVILGMFVLVWIISAVVKATQRPAPPPPRNNQRPRPTEDDQPDRTTNNEIDRFMAELDRLRQRSGGAAAPSGSRPQGQDQRTNRPKPQGQRARRETPRAVTPPPLPPVLPVLPPLPSTTPSASPVMSAPPPPPPPPAVRVARIARTAKVASAPVVASPVLETLQTLMKTKQGAAAAVILAEIFGEPRSRKPMSHPKQQS